MKIRIAASVLLAVSLVPGALAAPDLVLARVGGDPITLEQLRLEFERRHQGHLSILADEEVLRSFLDGAVRRRLFTGEARRLHLDEQAWVKERVAKERETVGTTWLFRTEVEEPVRVEPAAIEAALLRMKVASQVIAVETDSWEAAEGAKARIVAGEPADQVARELSVADSRTRGGLQLVAWGQGRSPALEEAAYLGAVGDVLGPIETETGFVVARVEARDVVEPKNAEMSRAIAENVLRRRATEARRGEYLDGLRAKYGARIDEGALDPARLLPVVRGEVPPEAGTAVATWNGGSIPLAEFAAGIKADAFAALRAAEQRRQAGQLLTNRVDEEMLRLEVAARWPEAPAPEQARVRAVEDDLIFRELLGGVVFADIKPSEDEIRAWYDAHTGDHVEPAKSRLAVALLATEEAARTFLTDAAAGARFEDLARERSQDKLTAAHGGTAGWVTEAEAIPALRGEPLAAASGTVGGPVQIDTGWLVWRVLDRVPERTLPFEVAHDAARAALVEHLSGERMVVWETKLRAVTEVKINDAALRKAGERLAAERAADLREGKAAPPPSHGGPRP